MKILILVVLFSGNSPGNVQYLPTTGSPPLRFSADRVTTKIKSPPFVLYNPKKVDNVEALRDKTTPKMRITPNEFLQFFSNDVQQKAK